MQSKPSNSTKSLEKIVSSFNKMQKLPKALIKYGTYIFLGIFTIGTVLVILNNTVLPFDSYIDLISKNIVKTSFVLVAEAVIGGLVMDYAFKK